MRSFLPFPSRLRRAGALLALALCQPAAWAGALDSLEAFIQATRSGRAAFTQVVTAPPRDGQAARAKTSSGSFEFQRPGRFRFVYKKPFEQSIVADGQTLWMHDVDLNQVTARKQSQVLDASPAALVASAPDLKSLERDFTLQAAADKEGLQWVLATPRSKDGQLQSIRVGLRVADKGVELAALEILDSFGQRSVLRFSQWQANPGLKAGDFRFEPPAGADVIRP